MYRRIVQYYETDKMGITHHSNYIRWMEEARTDFFKNIGWDYNELEKTGVICPVVGVSCDYKKTTTYEDKISIDVQIKEFRGIKLILSYVIKNETLDDVVAIGESKHCFLKDGKIIRMDKEYKEFYDCINSYIK